MILAGAVQGTRVTIKLLQHSSSTVRMCVLFTKFHPRIVDTIFNSEDEHETRVNFTPAPIFRLTFRQVMGVSRPFC